VVLVALFSRLALWAQPTIIEYPIASSGSSPFGITAGPDGNFWFTETQTNRIGKITASGTITEYGIPTPASGPGDIAAGPDGNLWFTEVSAGKIARITPAGAVTEYSLPQNTLPFGIAAGPDGALWFTESNSNRVGRITLSGSVTEYTTPSGAVVSSGITAGPDGNVWFTENNTFAKITAAGTITEYPLIGSPEIGSQVDFGLAGIVTGPDGNLWVGGNGAVWQVTTSGDITEFPLPAPYSAGAITLGADENLWVTDAAQNAIGRITPAGLFSYYAIPSVSSQTSRLAAGSDGNIWFTESATGKIGKLVVSTVPPLAPLTINPTALTFSGYEDGAAPPSQTLTITAPTPTAFSLSTNVFYATGFTWLTAAPNGTLATNQSISVTVSPQFLQVGPNTGAILVTWGNATQVIPVTYNVLPPPTAGSITASPVSLSFSYASQSLVPGAQSIAITSAASKFGAVPCSVTIAPANTWLYQSNSAGNAVPFTATITTPQVLYFAVNPAGLAPGTYTANIAFQPAGGSVLSVSVTLVVSASPTTLYANPVSLTFVCQVGSCPPPAQTIQVTESGVSAPFSVWNETEGATVNPIAGSAPLTLTVSPDMYQPGSATGPIVLIIQNEQVYLSIPVTITVLPQQSGMEAFNLPTYPANPWAIASGPGGLWFTEMGSGKIGLITTAGAVTEFSPSPPLAQPTAIVLGSDGNLWFNGAGTGIGKVTPAGVFTQYSLHLTQGPSGLTLGRDGNVWFAGPGDLGRITPAGAATLYALPSDTSGATAIVAGSDGNLWFAEPWNNRVSRITPDGATTTEFPMPTSNSFPGILALGPDGNIWCIEENGFKVAKITPAGTVTELSIFGSFKAAASGPDGNLWLADGSNLYRMTTAGTMTQYPVPGNGPYVEGIATGPDGNLWFTESGQSSIGRMVIASSTSAVAAVVNAASGASGSAAPGEIVTLYGSNLGPATPATLALNPDGSVATSLAGVTVTFNGHPAPLTYVSATQINCVVPYEVAGATGGVLVQVAYSGSSNAFSVNLATEVPGILTLNGSGSGEAAAGDGVGGYNGPAAPASAGSTLVFYVTGEGQTSPAGVTGAVTAVNESGSGPLTPQPVAPVTVSIGGQTATIRFYGEAPGLVAGVMQVNVQVPAGLPSGNVALTVSVGGVGSQSGVTVAVK
jgi:uncharacterized protein (TIGR03437 family)